MRLAWLTDIHLNFLSRKKLAVFVKEVAAARPDAVLLGGDVAEADGVADILAMLSRSWGAPIYFVLGNHDFYRGSIKGVRAEASRLTRHIPNLTWLNAADPIRLTERTTLIGCDGWGDGGFGNAAGSPIQINDFTLIEELRAAPRGPQRLALLRRLGEEAANHLRVCLPLALAVSEKVIVLTHVPPFREATWHEGRLSDDDWLPWFACRATGEALREAMESCPESEMLVLCGHTHGAGECQILPNLRVLTGGAEYGQPRVQRMVEIV
jgi:3',5'-cyclic AMP phosphodiesterase CpdA